MANLITGASMIGIGALLTDQAFLEVQALQRWLRERYGVPPAGFDPHLTFALADPQEVLEVISERITYLAGGIGPFTIKANGLGIFNGPSPTLYLPVPPSQQLIEVHRWVCEAVIGSGGTVQPYYRPGSWLPHITLASQGVSEEIISLVVGEWAGRRLEFSCWLTGFWLAQAGEEDRWGIFREFPFEGLNELDSYPNS